MNVLAEKNLNQVAFRRLAGFINQAYPCGRFVAIGGGEIIADAPSFGELESALKAIGQDSVDVLIVQAGVDYPETAAIFDADEQIVAMAEMIDRRIDR